MSNESENKLTRRVDDKRAQVPLQWNESGAAKGGITSLKGIPKYEWWLIDREGNEEYVKVSDVERLLASTAGDQAEPNSPEFDGISAAPASPEQAQAAERDLCTALLACPHTMDEERVVLYRNFTKDGNAYAQIADRLAVAFAKLAAPIAAAPAAEEVHEQQECWSANEEDFNATSLDQLMNENDHLKAGDTVWVGVAVRPKAKRLIGIETILEQLSESAYDIAGENADDYPDVSKAHADELEVLLADWIKRACPPNFWTVENIRPYVLTSADLSDDLTRPSTESETPNG